VLASDDSPVPPVSMMSGADPVVGTNHRAGRDGLRAGRIRLSRGNPAEGSVRPGGVVVELGRHDGREAVGAAGSILFLLIVDEPVRVL